MTAQAAQEKRNDTTGTAQRQTRFRTFAGTIEHGMQVLGANDEIIGEVDRVEGDHIVLAATSESGERRFFVPLSLIDGIHEHRVLLAGRGDASFGLGAEP